MHDVNILGIEPNAVPVLWPSILYSLVSALVCLVIGYPVAYFIASCKETTQRFLYMLVMLPMCISFLLRTLAWVALTEDTGIINNFITSLGLQPLPLIRNNGAVVLGMVYNYLPYMQISDDMSASHMLFMSIGI